MASGAPVITSECSSLPEVAGDAAVLIDPRDPDTLADAMLQVARGEHADLVSRGKARASRFTWAETARKTWDALCSLA